MGATDPSADSCDGKAEWEIMRVQNPDNVVRNILGYEVGKDKLLWLAKGEFGEFGKL
jgi:hypothetical protein